MSKPYIRSATIRDCYLSPSSPAADRPRIAINRPRPPHAIAIFSPRSCVGFLGLESRAKRTVMAVATGRTLAKSGNCHDCRFCAIYVARSSFRCFRALRLSADRSCGPRQQSAAGYPTGGASAVNRCAILTIAGFALPTVYGVYAVNDGELHELEPWLAECLMKEFSCRPRSGRRAAPRLRMAA